MSVTDLVRRAKADAVVRRALTGHVTESMQDHYSNVHIEEKRSAVAGVHRLVAEAKPGEIGAREGNDAGAREGSQAREGRAMKAIVEMTTAAPNSTGSPDRSPTRAARFDAQEEPETRGGTFGGTSGRKRPRKR